MTLVELKRIVNKWNGKGLHRPDVNKVKFYVGKEDIEKACQILLFHSKSLNDKGIDFDLEDLEKSANNKCISWYDTTQISTEYYTKNDKMEGLFKKWAPDGRLWVECNYKNDVYDGLFKSWNLSVNEYPHTECTYKDGELEGICKHWWGNGNLWMEYNYKNGQKEGDFKHYHVNSALKVEGTYKDDELEGTYRQFSASGFDLGQFNFSKGVKC
jgi:antitoxin component YwqK of YwqJK toxin-antitoxin module